MHLWKDVKAHPPKKYQHLLTVFHPPTQRVLSHSFSLFTVCGQPLATAEDISVKKNPPCDIAFPDPQKAGSNGIPTPIFLNNRSSGE